MGGHQASIAVTADRGLRAGTDITNSGTPITSTGAHITITAGATNTAGAPRSAARFDTSPNANGTSATLPLISLSRYLGYLSLFHETNDYLHCDSPLGRRGGSWVGSGHRAQGCRRQINIR